MKITKLEVEGIFSFGIDADRFVLEVDDGLTVIVGPNASGKSNVLRALNLAQTAVRFEDANQEARNSLWAILDDYVRGARHDGMPSRARSAIRLSVKVTGPAEIQLLTSYVQALVLSAIYGTQMADEQSLPALEAWVTEYVTPDSITDFFEGTIVVSHSGISGTQWNVSYEFQHDQLPLTWHINTAIPNLTNVIAPRDSTAADGLPQVMTLTQRLMGGNSPPPGPTLPPDTPFSLESMLPNGSDFVRVEMTSISTNVAPAPHRSFVASAGIEVPIGDPLGPYRRSYSLAAVLSRILDQSLWHLGVTGTGGPMEPNSSTDNGERPNEMTRNADIATRLFDLKNGDQLAQGRYLDIQGLFKELAPGRRFEVRTSKRQSGESPEQAIEIEVLPTSNEPASNSARPLRLAGTGVEQALIIAETLVGSPDRVLLLDEPATNLHPPWQRIVRSQLNAREGQCLLVTHSPFLIPADSGEQLASIVRFDTRRGATRTYRLTQDDLLDNRWVGTMIKELAWSADARGLLFAAGVVLLEGPTELSALPAWAAKSATGKRHRGPDDLHVAFYSVGGDQDFRPFVAYLERFGVPWAVVCDGAIFRHDVRKHIFEQVIDAGIDDPDLKNYVEQEIGIASADQNDMEDSDFHSMVEFGRSHGVFTLASGWHRKSDPEGDDESFEAFVESLPELAEAAKAAHAEAPKSKPRAGRLMAEATECPPAVNQLYAEILERLWQKGMVRFGAPQVDQN